MPQPQWPSLPVLNEPAEASRLRRITAPSCAHGRPPTIEHAFVEHAIVTCMGWSPMQSWELNTCGRLTGVGYMVPLYGAIIWCYYMVPHDLKHHNQACVQFPHLNRMNRRSWVTHGGGLWLGMARRS